MIAPVQLTHAATIAAGITAGAALKKLFGLSGLDALAVLEATVNECEDARKAAAWITPNLSDLQRRDAAQFYNTNCRNTVAATAATAAEAIAQGHGDTDVNQVDPYQTQPTRFTQQQREMREAQEWLNNNKRPSSFDWDVWLYPAPVCGPLDGACLKCAQDTWDFNHRQKENHTLRYQKAECIYDCALNTSTGHPERCQRCPEPMSMLPAPECYAGQPMVKAIREGGQIMTPNAAWAAAEPERFYEQPTVASSAVDPPPARTPATSTETPAPAGGAPEVTGGGVTAPEDWSFEMPDFGEFELPNVELPTPVQNVVNELPMPESIKGNSFLIVAAASLAAGAVVFGGRRR